MGNSEPQHASRRQWLLASAGLFVLVLVWLGPLPALARGAFVAHMTMHVSVMAIAAPLLALAIAGGPYDPSRRYPSIFAPMPASAVELVVVWGFHAPALHHAARDDFRVMTIEQGSFLVAGFVMWLSAFGGDTHQRDERRAPGIVGLLLTSMHMTLLGALLALSPRPLYHHGASGPGTLTALEDQHLGGALMLVGAATSYLAGGLVLAANLLRDDRRERGRP